MSVPVAEQRWSLDILGQVKAERMKGLCDGTSRWGGTWGFVANGTRGRAAERRHLRSPMREHWDRGRPRNMMSRGAATFFSPIPVKSAVLCIEMSPLRGLKVFKTNELSQRSALGYADAAAPRLSRFNSHKFL